MDRTGLVRRLAALACVAGAGLAVSTAQPVSADPKGDSNKGDVWLDNVGQPPGPGHEMDPHLKCADIYLWGDKLADSGGLFSIDGWPPSGGGAGDQAWPGTAATPDAVAAWNYNQALGGSQVIALISVKTLIAHAIANGDSPQNKQGFHFKLQFSQDPQKHKVFWVNCPAEVPPTPTPPTPTPPTPTPPTPTPPAPTPLTPTPNGGVQGIEAGNGNGNGPAAAAPVVNGGVEGLTTTPTVPATGGQLALGAALALLLIGLLLVGISRTRRSA